RWHRDRRLHCVGAQARLHRSVQRLARHRQQDFLDPVNMSGTGIPLVSMEVGFGAAPPQGMVTPLCQSLLELCRPVFQDEDAAARLRLTAHELLENIVKYSAEALCELRFELRRTPAGQLEAHIQTRNVPRSENR